jgi:hypothetical protein
MKSAAQAATESRGNKNQDAWREQARYKTYQSLLRTCQKGPMPNSNSCALPSPIFYLPRGMCEGKEMGCLQWHFIGRHRQRHDDLLVFAFALDRDEGWR